MEKKKSKSLKILAEEYQVNITLAIQAVEKEYDSVGASIPVYGERLEGYERIIQQLAESARPQKPEIKPGEKDSPKQEPKVPTKTGTKHPSRPHSPILSDYIVLTQSALRKESLPDFLQGFRETRAKYRLHNKIVIQSQSLEALAKEAEEKAIFRNNHNALQKMKENGLIEFIGGDISDEDIWLWKFINKKCERNTFVVVGRNEILSQKIDRKNIRNGNDPLYTYIKERELNEKGLFVNPHTIKRPFCPVQNQKKTICSESQKSITGTLPEHPGDVVYDRYEKPIILGGCDPNKSGAEGRIFSYKNNKCIKILFREHITELKIKKLQLMVNAYPEMYHQDAFIMNRIAWPEKIVYNEKGEEIGYIMRFFSETRPLSDYTYDEFPNIIEGITKTHQVRMAKSFAEIISFMHDNHVILCDLNTKNVMFDQSLQAYLVDMDSVQIADTEYYYPTRVGTEELLSPEHIEHPDNYAFLHKEADDVWAMQILLFQILTPAGHPYSTTLNKGLKWIVTHGCFPFQAGTHPAKDYLRDGKGGIWYNIFSYLPGFLKHAFWNAFEAEGENFHEDDRLPSAKWLAYIKRYEEELPNMIKKNPDYDAYWPMTSNTGEPDTPPKKMTDTSRPSEPAGKRNISWNTVVRENKKK